MTWTTYEPGDKDAYIPTSKWGKDHWSTFAYLETRMVTYRGKIENRHMRCNNRLHRQFAHVKNCQEYPTRLKDGEKFNHDDWSCLEDMVAAGYFEADFRNVGGKIFGGGKARVRITPEGKLVAAMIRAHKMAGGRYADFELP